MTTDIITACLEATGATQEQAARAVAEVRRPDIIALLVEHQAAALIRLGRPVDLARTEALDAVAVFLADVERAHPKDVLVGVAIRQAKVYRLKSQGVTLKAICERLAICPAQAKVDYKAELMRRRAG